MDFLWWILTGLIVGSIAQSVTGVEKRGCLFSILVGITGAVVGGVLFRAAGYERSAPGLIVAFVGAFVLCLGLRVLQRPRLHR